MRNPKLSKCSSEGVLLRKKKCPHLHAYRYRYSPIEVGLSHIFPQTAILNPYFQHYFLSIWFSNVQMRCWLYISDVSDPGRPGRWFPTHMTMPTEVPSTYFVEISTAWVPKNDVIKNNLFPKSTPHGGDLDRDHGWFNCNSSIGFKPPWRKKSIPSHEG